MAKEYVYQNEDERNETTSGRMSRVVSDKLTYLIVGGGIGAVLALLFAPKSGNELRGDIADATRKGYDKSREYGQQLQQKSGDYINTAKQKAGDVYSRAGGALNAARSEFSKAGEQSSQSSQTQQKSIASGASSSGGGSGSPENKKTANDFELNAKSANSFDNGADENLSNRTPA